MTTQSFKRTDTNQCWLLVDAKDKTLGRLASNLVPILTGKNKAEYSPNADLGDYVVVINARSINVTGQKLTQKKYFKHSGYPGGIKLKTLEKLLESSPEEVIKRAVSGLLPKNKLRRKMLSKLKVYENSEHPHQAQNPEKIDI